MSIPISPIASTASGFNPLGSVPALSGSNSPPATWRKYPSAIWLRAELPVQRKRTLGLDTGMLRRWRAAAGSAARSIPLFSLPLRQIILENDEHFPFIAVRVMHPCLILRRVAAVGLHLVASHESNTRPSPPDTEHICGRTHLNPHVGQCASLFERHFVKREIQRRILHIELGVTAPDFARLNPKHLAIELDALRHIPDIDGKVRLQGNHRLCGHNLLRFIFAAANVLTVASLQHIRKGK